MYREQNHVIKRGNKSFESVVKFRYFGTTLINQNGIREEIQSRLNVGNACYYLVQIFLSSTLLCKNMKSGIHRSIILPASFQASTAV
jgi:hypothetical protein